MGIKNAFNTKTPKLLQLWHLIVKRFDDCVIVTSWKGNIHIWRKLKLTLRPPCFVVEFFLVDIVLETTFKVPIIMEIYMCKIQDSKSLLYQKKISELFFNSLNYAPIWGVKIIQKHDVSMHWNCTAYKRSTVKILDIFRINRTSWFSWTHNF